MISLLEKTSANFNYVFGELFDDRTKEMWPSVGTLTTILACYIYFCKKAGPAWMKDRKPYNLTNVIFYYNIVQILVSLYLFYEGSLVIINNFNCTCQPNLEGDTAVTRKIINLAWIYMFVKVVDLLDTVFFVLRKKSRQISGLHLYHHFLMPIAAFIGLKYFPTGHVLVVGLLNTFVHTIMYTYYLISGLGPQYQKYLWWKKYVTMLQLIQFVLIIIHNVIPLFSDCAYPKWINALVCLYAGQFAYMFGKFYYKNYIKPERITLKSE